MFRPFQFARRAKGKGRTTRRVPGTMNKTEERYEREVIQPKYRSGDIIWYGFEALTFKLAPDLRYTPDFIVQNADGTIEAIEVKAGKKDGKPLVEDDSLVKIKSAAAKFPIQFRMTWKLKDTGAWTEREFEEA